MIKKILEKLENVKNQMEFGAEKFDYNQGSVDAYNNAIKIVQEESKNGGWIPFTQREMTEEEKESCGTEEGYMLDCPLPDEDEEILVTYANGFVDVDIFMRDGNECYLDSGNELVSEAIAWRKKPAPYKKGNENGNT